MTSRVGVAISTTGTRPEMLEAAERDWRESKIDIVTVQSDPDLRGVAWNKNRGIAALMDAGVEHLFLADDDMGPLFRHSWTRYVDSPALHLSLCWGRHRRISAATAPGGFTLWSWPRGVLLYAHRSVIEQVGGMRTEYGAGGHEHVEWSRRIHQAGLTEHLFADIEQDVKGWFHVEDMQRPAETVNQLRTRRRRFTTVKRTAADRQRIADLWREHDGDTSFVEYR